VKNMIVYTTIAMLLAGCSSESNFYQLHPSSQYIGQSSIKKHKVIAISDVQVADYLDKPQVITRVDKGELKLNEFDRWVGDIGKNIQQVLNKDISSKLPRYTILSKPLQEPIDEDYTLYVSIDRFDGDINGMVVLSGHWSLVDAQDRTLLKGKKFNYITHTQNDIASIVNAQSKLLSRLATNIAYSIK